MISTNIKSLSSLRNTSKPCSKPEADTWEESGAMSGKKRGQGADYTESLGLAMAYFDDPLEVTKDGVDFELLADYPNGDEVFGSDSGCLVAIDDRNFVVERYADLLCQIMYLNI